MPTPPPHDHEHRGGSHDHPRGGRALAGTLRHALAHAVHSHGHDRAELIDTTTADREGTRALAVGLGVLATTAAVQAVVAVASGSVALLADTVHNVSDALTAVPLGVAFWLGRRPPDRRYTYGYGRAEDLAGVVVVAVIALSALVACGEAVGRLVDPRPVDQAGWVALAGLVGFAGNEVVARHRIRVGRRIGSAALVADGLHARSDGLTSLAVVGAALGALAGWDRADPVIGLAIGVAIVNVLRYAARDVYRRLMDRVDPDLVDQMTRDLGRVAGIAGVDRVRIRWIGHELHADADVALSPVLPLAETHDILEDARHHLLHRIPRLADVVLHPNPAGSPGAHDRTAHHDRARAT